jgi:hypothetical protein
MHQKKRTYILVSIVDLKRYTHIYIYICIYHWVEQNTNHNETKPTSSSIRNHIETVIRLVLAIS